MRSTVKMCLAANNILLLRNGNQALGWKWQSKSRSQGPKIPSEAARDWHENKLGDQMIKQ